MLCPETWNFRAPASDFKVETSDVTANLCPKKINNFYYNHLVSVTVPDTLKVPKSVSDALVNDCDYYKVCNLDVSDFIDATFIASFIKSGTLTLLSVNRKIDCDDCIAVTPSKNLILSLTKEAYQSLGLEGVVSHFCTNNKYKYLVRIDLTKLSPGTKLFDRTKTCLKRLGHFDVILAWDAPKSDICPSSIAKYFDSLNYEVSVCTPQHETQIRYMVKAPVINFHNSDDECADHVEWLGMLALDGDIEGGDDFLSYYDVPEPNVTYGQVRILTWRGLFSSKKIEKIFNELTEYQRSEDKPWISLYVQGFSDSPVNFGEREHHYYTNGDNSYTIFISNEKQIICSSMCTYKRYNKKDKNKK